MSAFSSTEPPIQEVRVVVRELERARRLLCLGQLDDGALQVVRCCGWMERYESFILHPPHRSAPMGLCGARLDLRRALSELMGVACLLLMANGNDDQAARALGWAQSFAVLDCPIGASYERLQRDIGGVG
jgi:hypothetical protein